VCLRYRDCCEANPVKQPFMAKQMSLLKDIKVLLADKDGKKE